MGLKIEDYELLAGLGTKEIDEIGRLSTLVRVPSGRRIMVEGTLGRECFVVLSGSVAVERGGQHIADVGPGGVVGEIALLDAESHVRTATVTTLTESSVLLFSAREFNGLVADHPTVAKRIERAAVQRLVGGLRIEEER